MAISTESASIVLDTLKFCIHHSRNSFSVLQKTIIQCAAIYVFMTWAKTPAQIKVIVDFSKGIDFACADKLTKHNLVIAVHVLAWLNKVQS